MDAKVRHIRDKRHVSTWPPSPENGNFQMKTEGYRAISSGKCAKSDPEANPQKQLLAGPFANIRDIFPGTQHRPAGCGAAALA
jgi:hypothetical protein